MSGIRYPRMAPLVKKKTYKSPLEGPITPAEQRVIDDLMLGHTNKDIALCLGISYQTVKAHLTHIFAKYNVETRSQLILAETERLEKLKSHEKDLPVFDLAPHPGGLDRAHADVHAHLAEGRPV